MGGRHQGGSSCGPAHACTLYTHLQPSLQLPAAPSETGSRHILQQAGSASDDSGTGARFRGERDMPITPRGQGRIAIQPRFSNSKLRSSAGEVSEWRGAFDLREI